MNGKFKRTTGKSASNTAQTVVNTVGSVRKLLQVSVSYSGVPVYGATDLKIWLRSGKGSDYDVLLRNGTANEQYFMYVPESPITVMDDDHIEVVAPAAGNVTSAVSIITEDVSF